VGAEVEVEQDGQDPRRLRPQGLVPGEAGQPLHGDVPLDDPEIGVGDDQRVLDAVDDAESEVTQGRRTRGRRCWTHAAATERRPCVLEGAAHALPSIQPWPLLAFALTGSYTKGGRAQVFTILRRDRARAPPRPYAIMARPFEKGAAMRAALDPAMLVLLGLALVLAIVAYLKDPGLPLLGAKNGFSMLTFILPRMVPALMLAGLMQVLVPQEVVSRYFGRAGGFRAILIASVAGILTPGGPMISVPFMVALANSGAALPPLVAYMTSWSLFGMQRIIAWEAPLMGWHFVAVRTVSSLVFPILAGWLVTLYFHE
jgi:hypothetical protein